MSEEVKISEEGTSETKEVPDQLKEQVNILRKKLMPSPDEVNINKNYY